MGLKAQAAKPRNLHVDSLRGVAILLLVIHHVLIAFSGNGIIAEDGPADIIGESLAQIVLPLFTFLSGYVYAMKPFQGDWGGFISDKALRLLIPMLILGTLFALLQSQLPYTEPDFDNLYMMHVIPVRHFWYVEALLIVFVLAAVLEKLKLLENDWKFFLLFFAVFTPLSIFAGHFVEYFAIDGAAYLLPYFFLGVWLFRAKKCGPLCLSVAALSLVAGCVIVGWWIANGAPLPPKESFTAILIGCGGSVLLMRTNIQSALLAKLGLYSYSIYILHYFFTVPPRLLLIKVGVDNVWVLGVAATASGVLGPILCEMILKRCPPITWLVLGIRQKRSRRA